MSLVTQESIAQAVKDLELDGMKPTVNNVRLKLGGGSNTSIVPLLNEYLKSVKPELPTLTDIDYKRLNNLVDEIAGSVAQKAVASFSEKNRDYQIRVDELSQLNAEQEEYNILLSTRIAELEAEKATGTAENDTLKTRLSEMKEERDVAVDEAKKLRDELSQLKIRQEDWEEINKKLVEINDEVKSTRARADNLEGQLEAFKEIDKKIENLIRPFEIKPEQSQPQPEPEKIPTKNPGKAKKSS